MRHHFQKILVGVTTSTDEVEEYLGDGFDKKQLEAFRDYLRHKSGKLDVAFRWEQTTSGKQTKLTCIVDIESEDLKELLAATSRIPDQGAKEEKPTNEPNPNQEEDASKPDPSPETDGQTSTKADSTAEQKNEAPEESLPPPAPLILSSKDIATAIVDAAPLVTLFDQASGLLPDRVDIIEKEGHSTLTGDGAQAATNFLNAANIDLDDLVHGDARKRENVLRRANQEVTTDFLKFWKQTIGKTERLQLECSIENYGQGPKSGLPHLVFWISDGHHKLYLKQRSHGVRWFISFYVQLKASEKIRERRVFLLDEPGANLHSKAQEDVLRLINQLSEHLPIVYSTHSPHLIEYDKAYQILAVQRDGEAGDSPTRVIPAHQLGAASRDTLSPLLVAMGADFSQQQVIRKENNVILEEMSGAYYFMAIWKLLGRKEEAHFIAATGATNVESIANMFLGWGLGFAIVLDDDQMGRSVYNKIKKNMFGDEEDATKKRALKLPGCRGIEDIFSKKDFAKILLGDEKIDIGDSNSEYVKGPTVSKPVLAYRFWMKVSKGELKKDALDPETRKKLVEIADLVAGLSKASQ